MWHVDDVIITWSSFTPANVHQRKKEGRMSRKWKKRVKLKLGSTWKDFRRLVVITPSKFIPGTSVIDNFDPFPIPQLLSFILLHEFFEFPLLSDQIHYKTLFREKGGEKFRWLWCRCVTIFSSSFYFLRVTFFNTSKTSGRQESTGRIDEKRRKEWVNSAGRILGSLDVISRKCMS